MVSRGPIIVNQSFFMLLESTLNPDHRLQELTVVTIILIIKYRNPAVCTVECQTACCFIHFISLPGPIWVFEAFNRNPFPLKEIQYNKKSVLWYMINLLYMFLIEQRSIYFQAIFAIVGKNPFTYPWLFIALWLQTCKWPPDGSNTTV